MKVLRGVLRWSSACSLLLLLVMACCYVVQSGQAVSDRLRAQLEKGQEHAYAGQHAEGERHLSQYCAAILMLEPERVDVSVLLLLGHTVRRQGRVADALRVYNLIVRLLLSKQRCWAEPLFYMGMAAEAANDVLTRSRAHGFYTVALKCDSKHVKSLNNMACSHIRNSNHALAIPLLEKAVRIDPAFYEGLANLGGALAAVKEWHRALPVLRKSVEIESKEAMTQYYLGLAIKNVAKSGARAKFPIGALRDALKPMQRALELESGNKDMYYEAARLHNYLGNTSAVRATLRAMSLAMAPGGWAQGEGATYSALDYISKTYRASNPRRLEHAAAAAASAAAAPKALQRAAVVYLCCGDDEEFNELLRSLQLLQQYFISRFPYPVYIMCVACEFAQGARVQLLHQRHTSFQVRSRNAYVSWDANDSRRCQ
jgi:tetratricopeptide (TPR) repeat protein